jgi:hypothetical protein
MRTSLMKSALIMTSCQMEVVFCLSE